MTKYYHTIINLVALTVIVYAGVDIFYKVTFSGMEEVKTRNFMVSKTPDNKGSRLPLNSFNTIAERNLFGSLDKTSKESISEDIKALEPTSLQVALLGTVTGNNQDACAVIEEIGKRKQGLYKVGDSIQNALVKLILDGKVVLRVGDKDEVLSIEDSFSSGTGKGGRPAGPGDRAVSNITVKRSDIVRSLRNINKLLSEVRVRPHFVNGRENGLQITRIKRGSIFSTLGLRNGDIIQRVNNRPIRSADDVMVLYNSLKRGSRVSVALSRRQKSRTIRYRFR